MEGLGGRGIQSLTRLVCDVGFCCLSLSFYFFALGEVCVYRTYNFRMLS